MWNRTRISQLLKIRYPIIQGPFGGRFSSVRLVSTVSNLGGMGSFGLNAYGPEEISNINADIRLQTSGTYALNLWVPLENDPIESYTTQAFEKVRQHFKPHFERMNVSLPAQMNRSGQDFEAQVEAVLKARPPVASFIFGIPSIDVIKEFKRRGVITMAVATTAQEALAIEGAGLDVVIASGMEAGGHRASFLKAPEHSLESTPELVKKIRSQIDLPIVAAGGISTGTDIAVILQNGADAVQLGTVFLATEESNASAEHKAKLLSGGRLETRLTRVFSGRLARVITTNFVEEMDRAPEVAPYPVQSSLLAPLRKSATAQGLLDYEAFWSGQLSSVLKHQSATKLFESLVSEAELVYPVLSQSK